MGVSELNAADGSKTDAPDWWVPQGGPIERLMRQSCEGGTWTWVAHASPSWSREHLEDAPETTMAALREAVAQVLGRPLLWHASTVHRWRYARPVLTPSAGLGGSRWDAGLGLGLCGDYLAGLGADAAWTSGTALAQRILAAGPLCHAPPPLGRADGAVLLASAPR
jgi:predicted NAD/FAD-dependent oxidoreductase